MTEPSRAVFLSYASQDAEAAQRICETLRVAGIEVWFDQSELRGGDAWDQSIRRQIKHCALFIPVISRNTHTRDEGYFRLEWKLAVDRSHLMTTTRAFLIPVAIDDVRDDDEAVPEKFRDIQWTRLPGGETPPAFVDRIRRLLAGGDASASETAPVAATKADRPAAAGLASLSARVPTSARRPWKHWGLYGAIAVLVLFGIGYFTLARKPAPPAVATAVATSTTAVNSIAVLPLADLSRAHDQQYFSDGLSESLITALAQIPQLKVIGKSSSFLFRDSKESSHRIGEQLGVARLLVGSVQRFGDQIRVSAELINTSDGTTVWSQQYDRAYKDLFALEDEITQAVADALKAKLLPDASGTRQDERPPSGSLAAYNALLEGRFYLDRGSEGDFRKAIDFFTEATRIDPHYALAWAQLGTAWVVLAVEFLEPAPAREAYAKAHGDTLKALSLDPQLAYAHAAHGYVITMADFDWRGAEAEYRQALELAPRDPQIQFYLGTMLAIIGQVQEAVALTRQALGAEPLKANWYNWLARYLSGIHRLDEAEQAIRKAIELQPTAAGCHEELAIILIQRGEAPAALEAAQQEPAGVWQDVALALARQVGEDRGAADAALKKLIEKDSGGAAYQIAQVYALRGDADAAFQWLDRAWSNRDPGIENLHYDPFLLRYKDDPRFAAFCRKAGLPAPGEISAHTST